MSKLYNKYIEKKKENNNKVYLFKSGNFYIFLGEDVKVMSEELGLKFYSGYVLIGTIFFCLV